MTGAATPLILLAPGAGAPSSSAWMRRFAARLTALGAVETFDYDYAREGRRAPDPLPRLIAAHRAALAAARARHPEARRVVLAGKSMGSRIGCHASLVEPGVVGLVCFGYPLRPAGGGKLRDEVLRELAAPVLFVQGTRDPLGPLDLLDGARRGMRARSELHVVEDGDHSLEVRKRFAKAVGTTQEAIELAALEAVRRFIESLTPPEGVNL